MNLRLPVSLLLFVTMNTSAAPLDLILRRGTIYDGSGGPPFVGDVAVSNDVVVAVGDVGHARARREIDCAGLAVAPGFINMLSWANARRVGVSGIAHSPEGCGVGGSQ